MTPQPATRRERWTQALVLMALGAAPDLDLLIGRHRQEAHSIGAAAIVATVAAWRRWPLADSRTRIWIAAAAAWTSHVVLDALGTDAASPFGIMAFWPFTRAYFLTGWNVFAPISRRCCDAAFVAHDAGAALREIAILAPIVAALWLIRRART